MIKIASSSDKNGDRVNFLAPFVEKMDSNIHRINHYPVDKYLETNYAIQWIEIYTVDSAIHLPNNWGQKGKTLIKKIIE